MQIYHYSLPINKNKYLIHQNHKQTGILPDICWSAINDIEDLSTRPILTESTPTPRIRPQIDKLDNNKG